MSYLIGLIGILEYNYIYFSLAMVIIIFLVFKFTRDILITNIAILFFTIYGYLLGIFPLFFVYILILLIVVLLILPKSQISGVRI